MTIRPRFFRLWVSHPRRPSHLPPAICRISVSLVHPKSLLSPIVSRNSQDPVFFPSIKKCGRLAACSVSIIFPMRQVSPRSDSESHIISALPNPSFKYSLSQGRPPNRRRRPSPPRIGFSQSQSPKPSPTITLPLLLRRLPPIFHPSCPHANLARDTMLTVTKAQFRRASTQTPLVPPFPSQGALFICQFVFKTR